MRIFIAFMLFVFSMLTIGLPVMAGYETGAANQVLRVPSDGGRPVYGAVDLSASAAVTNQLPIAKGGTGHDGTVGAKTAAYTTTAADKFLKFDMSGSSNASYAVTLHTAVGNSGQTITLLITNGTGILSVNTTSSQTVRGLASGVIKLATLNETLEVVSDGANWQILNHNCDTPWVEYTPTFVGFGTVGSTHVSSRRVGDTLEFAGQIVTGTVTAVQATMSLGFNGVNGNVTTLNDNRIQNNANIGTWINANFGQAANAPLLATLNVGYISFGLANGSRTDATAYCLASSCFASSTTIAFSGKVPIQGWFK